MLEAYEAILEPQVEMYREKRRRGFESPSRGALEESLWRSIEDHALSFYEGELEWVRKLASSLGVE
jgi:hypothetical protein